MNIIILRTEALHQAYDAHHHSQNWQCRCGVRMNLYHTHWIALHCQAHLLGCASEKHLMQLHGMDRSCSTCLHPMVSSTAPTTSPCSTTLCMRMTTYKLPWGDCRLRGYRQVQCQNRSQCWHVHGLLYFLDVAYTGHMSSRAKPESAEASSLRTSGRSREALRPTRTTTATLHHLQARSLDNLDHRVPSVRHVTVGN